MYVNFDYIPLRRSKSPGNIVFIHSYLVFDRSNEKDNCPHSEKVEFKMISLVGFAQFLSLS